MSINDLYEHDDAKVADYLDVPGWIEQNISTYDVAAIIEGGCASGAYMPAVTYHQAVATMGQHGDDVLQFIQDCYGELPKPDDSESWSGIAVFYLSAAVELWAIGIEEELTAALEHGDEEE